MVSTRATAELGRKRSSTLAADSQTSSLEPVGLLVVLLEFAMPPMSGAMLYSASPGESLFSDPRVVYGDDGSVRRIVADFGRGCKAACGVVLVSVKVCVGCVCWSKGTGGKLGGGGGAGDCYPTVFVRYTLGNAVVFYSSHELDYTWMPSLTFKKFSKVIPKASMLRWACYAYNR